VGRIVIEHGGLRLEIDPAIGAGIADFSLRGPDGAWWPVMRRAPLRPAHFNDLACYLLAPWSNRIAGARFEFGGHVHQLEPDWPDGTAIHGLVKDKPWRILDRSPFSARLAFDGDGLPYPFAFACEARYEVVDRSLVCDLAVRNTGEAPMPAGCGFHPFFRKRLWEDEECLVLCRVAGRYPATGQIPTGPAAADAVTVRLAAPHPLGRVELDDVFDGFAGAAIGWPGAGVRAVFGASAALGHAVIYAPVREGTPLPFFCLEPVSMVNDGFNALARGEPGTGVTVLAPGESLAVRWALRIEETR
jgi:aldose 1-epimerase